MKIKSEFYFQHLANFKKLIPCKELGSIIEVVKQIIFIIKAKLKCNYIVK
jgi:hypothetical protein